MHWLGWHIGHLDPTSSLAYSTPGATVPSTETKWFWKFFSRIDPEQNLLTACTSNTSEDHVFIIDDICQHMLSAARQESCGCGRIQKSYRMHLMCNSIHVKEPRMLIGEYPFEDQCVVSCVVRFISICIPCRLFTLGSIAC